MLISTASFAERNSRPYNTLHCQEPPTCSFQDTCQVLNTDGCWNAAYLPDWCYRMLWNSTNMTYIAWPLGEICLNACVQCVYGPARSLVITLVQVSFEPHLYNLTVYSNTSQRQNLPMLLAALNVPTLLYVLPISLLVWFPILL